MSISILNTDAQLTGKTLMTLENAETITGLKTFDRDPNAPFAVPSGSAVVPYLDADKVDGIEGTAFLLKAGGTMTGNLLFTDATLDIGASGATRPRDLFLSRNAVIGGTLTQTGIATFAAVPVFSAGLPTLAQHLLFTDATYDIGASGATRPRTLYLSADLIAGDQLFERGRAAALGEWTAVTFAAGNFTASGSMTWTVAEADVTAFAYMLVGKTMFLNLKVTDSTVGGTLSSALRVTLPASSTIGRSTAVACAIRDNASWETGVLEAVTGLTYLQIFRPAAANWSASTNATEVRINMMIETT